MAGRDKPILIALLGICFSSVLQVVAADSSTGVHQYGDPPGWVDATVISFVVVLGIIFCYWHYYSRNALRIEITRHQERAKRDHDDHLTGNQPLLRQQSSESVASGRSGTESPRAVVAISMAAPDETAAASGAGREELALTAVGAQLSSPVSDDAVRAL